MESTSPNIRYADIQDLLLPDSKPSIPIVPIQGRKRKKGVPLDKLSTNVATPVNNNVKKKTKQDKKSVVDGSYTHEYKSVKQRKPESYTLYTCGSNSKSKECSTKNKNQNTYGPWWNDRKKEMSPWLTYDIKKVKQTKLAWIKKDITKATYPLVDIKRDPSLQKEKKVVKPKTGLSKKKLEEDEVMRSLKIRIKPTPEQKQTFHKMFSVTRFVYNKAIDRVRGGWKPNFKSLNKEILNGEENFERGLYPWLFEHDQVPRDAKSMAVKELCDAYHTTAETKKAKRRKKRKRKKTEHTGEFKENEIAASFSYRSRKDDNQRFLIPCNGGAPSVRWEGEGFRFWPTKVNGIVKAKRKKDLEKAKNLCGSDGCRKTGIIKYESGRWFLILPFVKKKKQQTSDSLQKPVIALDPGIRTFQAGYDSYGRFTEYGTGDIQHIYKRCLNIDKLQSKIDTMYYKKE